jgi:predicted nucleotide-binding protein
MAAKLTKQQAIDKLYGQALQINKLIRRAPSNPAFVAWKRDTEIAISHIFGQHSRHNADFANIEYGYGLTDSQRTVEDKLAKYKSGLHHAAAILQSMMQEIKEYWDDDMSSSSSAIARQTEEGQAKSATRDVFVVHGHDDAFKQTVTRVLHQLDLNPVILHEKPDQGKSIIEKHSDYADVSFAVALFTPDDLGEAKERVKAVEDLRDRAGQNVVFELGYFIGRLGRSNAVALVKGHIEFPSDYSGVIYIPVDEAGSWRFTLVRELRAAGFDVDANRLL